MARSALLIFAALVAACAQITGAVSIRHHAPLAAKLEKSGRYMPILCSPLPASATPPSSVHALRPADVSAVYTLGLPVSHREEASSVANRVAELLSMFNSEVVYQHMDESSQQSSTLFEEAEKLSHHLAHQATDWKLLLLFVPADSMCACAPSVAEEIKAVVQEVKASLQLLQEQLDRTLVHVVVWSSNQQQDFCDCFEKGTMNQRLQTGAFLKTLLDSLSDVLDHPELHSEKSDFTAVLQPWPVILKHTDDEPNQAAVQLWTNMIQPSTGRERSRDKSSIFPCPSEEHPFLRTQMNSPVTKTETSPVSDFDMGTVVNCGDHNPSGTYPTSVHELKPADIKVVAAVGDSLTAGNGVGAKNDNILLVLTQYRGLSWSVGGDETIATVTTLPNILREFNPDIIGSSLGTGGETSPGAFLNQAVAGAKSEDMVDQVRILVNKMKNDPKIDFQNDWKVITMFIGGNDICDYCSDTVWFSARNVVLRIRDALDILHQEVPRAVVNLVEMLDIIPLRGLHEDSAVGCPTWLSKLLCPCILNPKEGSVELQKAKEFNLAYQAGMRELIDTGRYDTHDNFTVLLQPFLREIFLPYLENGLPDRSYFAPDCFHLSQKAHTLMARALWNSLFEPVGNKTFQQDFTQGVDLICPAQNVPFIRTAANSGYTHPGPEPTPAPNTNWGSDFSCYHTAPSNSVPTSAHKVRPADIQVVAAVGDSLTAGFGARAKSLGNLWTEYRGVSWSIGGDDNLENVTTIPNILKKFNPNLKGESRGEGDAHIGFNMAISGAKVGGIPGQIRTLIDHMKNDSTVDFENDWKLITLFIGGNDLCQYCNDRATLSPKNYSNHMMTSLDLLYEEVPRAIVNVLSILEILDLRRIERDSLGCNVLQPFFCPCVLTPKDNSPEMAEIKRVNRDMQDETEKLVYGGRYDGKEDFAVVLQPFFKNTVVPLDADGRPDDSYFSQDCFHFSERGHADMASALWNNMMEPVGEKQSYTDFRNDRSNLKCPTEEHPYIFTRVNSLVAPPVTEAPPPVTEAPPQGTSPAVTVEPPGCGDVVPVWLAAVLPIIGLLVGVAVASIFCSCKAKKSKKKANKLEMKGTGF